MRTSPLSVMAVVVLLVLAGCAGLPSAGENQPSPDEFPNASKIDQSVFDQYTTELENTSFTLLIEKTRKQRVLVPSEDNFTHMNDTILFFVEPNASQYIYHTSGYFTGNGTIYSNGSAEYVLFQDTARQ